MRIGIDVMGGDHYPHAPIGGVKSVQPHLSAGEQIVLLGKADVIQAELLAQGLPADAFEIIHTDEVIAMDEHPAKAIQGKPNSSISVGLDMVKSGQLDAFLSMGSTGALTAGAVLKLGLVPGLSRPTVGALYPHPKQLSLICDVGLNTDCKPEQLAQFGVLGSVYMQAVQGVQKPRVALLNVGEEKSKGNQAAKEAYQLLEADPRIQFIGNAEGRDLQQAKADVYVVDGFTGNILLKFAESLYAMMKQFMPNDKAVEGFNFEAIGGLPVLGVRGVVMVGHGISGPKAYHNMVLRTAEVVRSGMVARMEAALAPATDAVA